MSKITICTEYLSFKNLKAPLQGYNDPKRSHPQHGCPSLNPNGFRTYSTQELRAYGFKQLGLEKRPEFSIKADPPGLELKRVQVHFTFATWNFQLGVFLVVF